ncbi:PREDICTED: probable protein phosphatase 2C T23F11.1 [Nicrophorus vespilloides]|uniref:protein-serine/threonine phosphatase n=1 Tax=Nicrophorus vespilloides TaxID=110193 RepID=A0ABM1MXE9_NICVS|nr:PREDICTED: probable protein phosphatase 2C T23F11.1 [Nicrophorus vespilloides]
MGQTLSEPETAKDTACCQNSEYRVGSSCMQGWRINMEDSHTHILSLPDDPGTAFFAVYDGHGGAKIAEYAGKNLHKLITKRCEYKDGDVVKAMEMAFLEIDDIMLIEESLKNEQAGSTAVTMIIKDNTVFCANVGDSRAIASVNGKVQPLSFDHKPTNEKEYNRITAAGGWVEYNRVNGNLALSRALGDFTFKRNEKKKPEDQIVTAFPDVEVHKINENWEFIVLACDGIWDVMKNEEVVAFVRENLAAGVEPEDICENLMMKCLAPDCQMAGLGCDNMTVVIVGLMHGKTFEELSARCAVPAEVEENEDTNCIDQVNESEENTSEDEDLQNK